MFYITLDKGLGFFLRKLGFAIQTPAASFTGGLVGDSSPFTVLPQVICLTRFTLHKSNKLIGVSEFVGALYSA